MNNQKGTTMVEVIVAFALFLMSLVMLLACVQTASRMQSHALEQRKRFADVEEQIYEQEMPDGVDVNLTFSGDLLPFSISAQKTKISVTVDEETEYSFEAFQIASTEP